MRLIDRWERFWFTPAPIRRLGIFRIVIATYALLDVVRLSPVSTRARVDDMFYEPLPLLRLLHVPRPGAAALDVLNAVLLVALVCALVGVATRAALWVSAIAWTVTYAHVYSFGGVYHGSLPIVLALAALAVGPAGQTYALRPARRHHGDGEDPLAGWALRVVQVGVVLFYLAGAWAKLVKTGPGWPWSGALDAAMLSFGTPLGLRVAAHSALAQAVALGGFLFEATSFVLLARGRIRYLWVAAALGFHLGVLLLMGLEFGGMTLCLLAFLKLERVPDMFTRERAGAARPTEAPA